MKEIYTITGELIDERTVALDKPLLLGQQKLKLTIEQMPSDKAGSYREVVARLRVRQQERSHCPPTRDEVEKYLENERSDWDG